MNSPPSDDIDKAIILQCVRASEMGGEKYFLKIFYEAAVRSYILRFDKT